MEDNKSKTMDELIKKAFYAHSDEERKKIALQIKELKNKSK